MSIDSALSAAGISGVPSRSTVALAIMCKTPIPGASKTRLSPPLREEECAAISGCFIRDLAATMIEVASAGSATPYAVYSPRGSEARLQALLPPPFRLLAQSDGDLGARLLQATVDLLRAGHAGVILVNSDSPTLPLATLRAAVDAVLERDNVTLGPALDGGYTLIGLSRAHPRLFEDIPWSSPQVYQLTLDRASEIGLPVTAVPGWYDVDDAASLALLEAELSGLHPAGLADGLRGADAGATRCFLLERHRRNAAPR